MLTTACGEESTNSGNLRIVDMYPTNNAFGVPIDTTYWIEFNSDLNQATINELSFFLFLDDTQVQSNVTYNTDTRIATLSPVEPLTASRTYVAGVLDVIEDVNGNGLEPFSWTFITVSQAAAGSGDTLSANYRLTFEAKWRVETHPTDFPSNAHFTGLIGMTHNDSAALFVPGELASTGIKNVAEAGSKTVLISEIEELISAGDAQLILSSGGTNSPGIVTLDFTIKSSHPYVSLVSMIGPSPDWFVAIENVQLNTGGFWLPTLSRNVRVYDSGTDSGSSFKSSNLPTSPPDSISAFTGAPLSGDSGIRTMATISFEKID